MVFQLDRHLATIDTEIGKRLAEDERLARRTEILTSIPGVSRVTAAGLLTQDTGARPPQLVAEGQPRKVAVVVVMRKLLVLANARLDQDRC